MTKWQLERQMVDCAEKVANLAERFDLDRITISELNEEIDRLHDECNARAKEQELVEESLGKALGFVDADGNVDLPVCKTSTLASIAADKLSRYRFQFHGFIRDREEIDQILGKSLGYPLYEKFNDSDEDVVNTSSETVVSLAQKAAEAIESLTFIMYKDTGTIEQFTREIVSRGKEMESAAKKIALLEGDLSSAMSVHEDQELRFDDFVIKTRVVLVILGAIAILGMLGSAVGAYYK